MTSDLRALLTNRTFRRLPVSAQIDLLSEGRVITGPVETVFHEGLFIVCLSGRGEVSTVGADVPIVNATTRLHVGQDVGTYDLYSGHRCRMTLRLTERGRALVLDRATMDRLVVRHPELGYRLALTLARRMKRLDDGLSDALELQTFFGPTHGQRLIQITMKELYGTFEVSRLRRRCIALWDRGTQYAKNPLTWVFVGYLLGIGIARAAVKIIFRFELQEILLNRRTDAQGLTVHIHHFHYGIILMVIAALLALAPAGRRFTVLIGTLFGLGLGIFFDEFGLVLNLNPDYYQLESVVAMIVTGLALLAAVPLSERVRERRR